MTKAPKISTVVLSIGYDDMLMRLREIVLETAGYKCCSLKSSEFDDSIHVSAFDVVVFCRSVPPPLAMKITEQIRKRHRKLPFVRLGSDILTLQSRYDVSCEAMHGPVPLLHTLRRLVSATRLEKAVAAPMENFLMSNLLLVRSCF